MVGQQDVVNLLLLIGWEMGIAGGKSRRGGGRGPSTTAAPSACCNARNAVSAYRDYRFKKVVTDSVTFMQKLGLFVIQKRVFQGAPQKKSLKDP